MSDNVGLVGRRLVTMNDERGVVGAILYSDCETFLNPLGRWPIEEDKDEP